MDGEKVALLARVDARAHRRAKAAALAQNISLALFTERALRRAVPEVPSGQIVARAIRAAGTTSRDGVFNAPGRREGEAPVHSAGLSSEDRPGSLRTEYQVSPGGHVGWGGVGAKT